MEAFESALELARRIREGEVTPEEAVDAALERLDRWNPVLNAAIWRRDEDLRREARDAGKALRRGDEVGPFHGVPLPIKDLNDVEGWPTTFGSRTSADRISTFTCDVVERLRAAGFLLMCRTNTPEFGTLPVTENDQYGATRNPWNPEHTPGGSSGGAAALVAAGVVPVGHANDGGGSIRIPASACGLVGLKPSRGRIGMGPLVSDVMHGGVCEGVVTRTVADTAALLDVMAGHDPGAWYNAPPPERPYLEEVGVAPGKLRIAYTTEAPTGAEVEQGCIDAVQAAAKLMADLGHDVFEGRPEWPDPADSLRTFMTVWNTGTAYWDVQDPSKMEPVNAALAEHSRMIDSATYVRAVAELQVMSRQITRSWGQEFDVLMTPTLSMVPPKVGWCTEGSEIDPLMPMAKSGAMAAFTPLFNVTGQPAVSLPLHWSESGLPVGVQFVGAPWSEDVLIRLAAQVEAAAGWRGKRPEFPG